MRVFDASTVPSFVFFALHVTVPVIQYLKEVLFSLEFLTPNGVVYSSVTNLFKNDMYINHKISLII